MGKLNTARLKQALVDSTLLSAEDIIQKNPESISASEAHRIRINNILNGKNERKRYSRISTRVIIILIAALLILLTSCTKFYKKIAEFFVTVFDNYDQLKYAQSTDEHPQDIADIQVPDKMLPGYEISSEEIFSFVVRLKWSNPNGNYIIFTQRPNPYTIHTVDNEIGQYEEMIIGEHKIFFHCYSEFKYCYIWFQNYEFRLESSRQLTKDELNIIINSIK